MQSHRRRTEIFVPSKSGMTTVSFRLPCLGTFRGLKTILGDADVMKWMAEGSAWEDTKITEAMATWMEDWNRKPGNRSSFTWVVVCGKTVGAVVRIHRFSAMEEAKHHITGDTVMKPHLFHGCWFCTFAVHPQWQNQGVASTALDVLCRVFFQLEEGKNVDCVFCAPSPANLAASRCLRKANFVPFWQEGLVHGKKTRCRMFRRSSGFTTTVTTPKTLAGGARGGASRTPSPAARDEDSARA